MTERIVEKSRKKPVIGILGGIGSGKSTVAAEFAKLGCAVIDADEISHKLLEEQAVREKIVMIFGDAVLGTAGNIDRGKLAKAAFAGSEKLTLLNEIIHPMVLRRTERLIEQYNNQPSVKAIVLDMPLLAEVGWEKRCDRIVFVDCSEKLRRKRAEKLGLNPADLKIRENFQISLDNKALFSDNTVNNNSDLAALTRQVTDIFSGLINDY